MAVGQMLFKKTALSISSGTETSNGKLPAGLFEGVILALQVPWLYAALVVYATATVTWLYILQRIPLSMAYPFSALSMIIVPLASTVIFDEKLSFNYWFGATLIILGISVIAR